MRPMKNAMESVFKGKNSKQNNYALLIKKNTILGNINFNFFLHDFVLTLKNVFVLPPSKVP